MAAAVSGTDCGCYDTAGMRIRQPLKLKYAFVGALLKFVLMLMRRHAGVTFQKRMPEGINVFSHAAEYGYRMW